LHCLVPTEHLMEVEALVEELQAEGWGSCLLIRSRSGWQHISRCGHASSLLALGEIPQDRVLLRQHPIIVPLIAEAWNRDATLPLLWTRIHNRLAGRVRDYLPRRRVLPTNGKHHLRAACERLIAAGLFRQQLVRYQPKLDDGVEILVAEQRLDDHMVEL